LLDWIQAGFGMYDSWPCLTQFVLHTAMVGRSVLRHKRSLCFTMNSLQLDCSSSLLLQPATFWIAAAIILDSWQQSCVVACCSCREMWRLCSILRSRERPI
jgi:hypothetical protein